MHGRHKSSARTRAHAPKDKPTGRRCPGAAWSGLEPKEPCVALWKGKTCVQERGCGAGCGDRPGTESTAEGQATQGRGVLSVQAATVSRNQQEGMAISPCAAG